MNIILKSIFELLVSSFPMYHEFTLARIRLHVLYMPYDTLLNLGPFQPGLSLKKGSSLIIFEILDWYWCKPCANLTRAGQKFKVIEIAYGKGISINIKITGFLSIEKIGNLNRKIDELNFSFARIIFPNSVLSLL
ncbi:hypothetical protein HZS_7955 [Henneguya salminicola]|nr:hypothetical protein HZS_7955 [Henneguya salminicola]